MQSIFGVDVNLLPGNEPAEPENERRKTYGLKDERITIKRNRGLEWVRVFTGSGLITGSGPKLAYSFA